jgi:hypothetical protein
MPDAQLFCQTSGQQIVRESAPVKNRRRMCPYHEKNCVVCKLCTKCKRFVPDKNMDNDHAICRTCNKKKKYHNKDTNHDFNPICNPNWLLEAPKLTCEQDFQDNNILDPVQEIFSQDLYEYYYPESPVRKKMRHVLDTHSGVERYIITPLELSTEYGKARKSKVGIYVNVLQEELFAESSPDKQLDCVITFGKSRVTERIEYVERKPDQFSSANAIIEVIVPDHHPEDKERVEVNIHWKLVAPKSLFFTYISTEMNIQSTTECLIAEEEFYFSEEFFYGLQASIRDKLSNMVLLPHLFQNMADLSALMNACCAYSFTAKFIADIDEQMSYESLKLALIKWLYKRDMMGRSIACYLSCFNGSSDELRTLLQEVGYDNNEVDRLGMSTNDWMKYIYNRHEEEKIILDYKTKCYIENEMNQFIAITSGSDELLNITSNYETHIMKSKPRDEGIDFVIEKMSLKSEIGEKELKLASALSIQQQCIEKFFSINEMLRCKEMSYIGPDLLINKFNMNPKHESIKVKLLLLEVSNHEKLHMKQVDYVSRIQLIFGQKILNWDEESLCIPFDCQSKYALAAIDIGEIHGKKDILKAFENAAKVIVHWNTNYVYNETYNSQNFVQNLINSIGIQITEKVQIAMKEIRSEGSFPQYYIKQELAKKLGKEYKEGFLTFKTHAELDKFVLDKRFANREHLLPVSRVEEELLLHAIDRAFWLKHYQSPNDIRFLEHSSGCAFGNPEITPTQWGYINEQKSRCIIL